MKTKVLVVEEYSFTRQGIVSGLKKYRHIEVIGEACNGKKAVDLAIKYSPDIILMDPQLPVLTGIQATKEIKSFNKNIKIIIFTSNTEREVALLAFNSGADAYCVRNIKIPDLINVIDIVVKGAVWIDPKIATYILEVLQTDVISDQIRKNKTKKKKHDYNLTIREKQILKLISKGLTNKEISEQLIISLYTVKHHVSSIIKKLAVDDRTQAAIIALEENLFDLT